jgi:hypothetical protein
VKRRRGKAGHEVLASIYCSTAESRERESSHPLPQIFFFDKRKGRVGDAHVSLTMLVLERWKEGGSCRCVVKTCRRRV